MKAPSRRAVLGFSLIEVMVAVWIVSFGLLGLSKMQAAALANTQIARSRSIIALQASSLASMMRGNRVYWANKALMPKTITASGSSTVKGLGASADCQAAACTAEQLAAYDFATWMTAMNARFPDYEATVSCQSTTGSPVNCTVGVTWGEKYLATNAASSQAVQAAAASGKATVRQQFMLLVQP